MSNRALVIWSLALCLPVQYLWALGLRLHYTSIQVQYLSGDEPAPGPGNPAFGCSDFHSSVLQACSFVEMLGNVLQEMIFANVLSLGLATAFFFCLVATLLWFVRAAVRRVTGH